MIKCLLNFKNKFAAVQFEFSFQICYAAICFNENSVKTIVELTLISTLISRIKNLC